MIKNITQFYLNSTMVRLKHSELPDNEQLKTNLNSTMVRLKQIFEYPSEEILNDLNSTMVRLKLN